MWNGNEGTISKRVKIKPKIVNSMLIEYATNNKTCRFTIDKSELLDSQVKYLNDLEKNQWRMYLIKRFKCIINVNGQITSSSLILWHFFLKMSLIYSESYVLCGLILFGQRL